MRSGSPADDGGWPSAQHPYGDGPTSGPGPNGPGRRGESQQGRGGSGEVPFGPDISWPNGFRQLDTDSRRVLESGYGSGGYPSGGYRTPGPGPGQYDHVDPGYGRRPPGRAGDSGYWPPAMDDTGYGDPGYSDPTYEGPRSVPGASLPPGGGRGGRASGGYDQQPGYQVPDYREPVRPEFGYQQGYVPPLSAPPEIYPVTGAQEALPETGPQPGPSFWSRPDQQAAPSYPEQWYEHPRLDPPPAPAPDPRLAGMRYDELHYEDPPAGYEEPLDDDAWVQELRRSAPAYPQTSAGPSDPSPRRADPPRASGFGPQPGSSQPPSSGPQPGSGQPPSSGSHPGSGPQAGFQRAPGREQPPGFGSPRDDRSGPRMSARPETGDARPSFPRDLSGQGFLGAPAAPVGLLTSPAVRPLEAPAEAAPLWTGSNVLAAPDVRDAPDTRQFPVVRPGHGLDGPSITSSWPAQPQADEVESYEDFWREDDDDEYRGLFPDEDGARDTGPRAKRGTGRRRGRSNDHRLWLALLGVILAAGAAIFGIIKFEFPSHGGPVHSMVTPARIGGYVRTVNLEKQTHLAQLRAEVITMSSGHASNVVSAAYESGNSAAGATEQIIMFIGGHLANAAPSSSIASFVQKFPAAVVVPAGSLGGQAACVENGTGTSNPVSMCVWFDNDSFGEIVSPTMNANALSTVMRTVRPSFELVVRK